MNDDITNINDKFKSDLLKTINDFKDNNIIFDIYGRFKFLVLSTNSNVEEMINCLHKITLVTYQISNPFKVSKNLAISTKNYNKYDPKSTFVNAVICTEITNSDKFDNDQFYCFIIENFELKRLDSMFKNAKSLLIDVSATKIENYKPIFNEKALKSIIKFGSSISRFINRDSLAAYIFNPIITFYLYRNYCPSYFFDFPIIPASESNNEDFMMFKIKKDLFNFLKPDDLIEYHLQDLITSITNFFKPTIEINKKKLLQFKKSDFRTLYSSENERASYKVVFHIKKSQLFLLEDFSDRGKCDFFKFDDTIEIECCKKFDHRSITPVYGFIKSGGTETGIVYKFMSNDKLGNYFHDLKEGEKVSPIFLFMIAVRIVHGIRNVHSNNYIECEINRQNILIDNDLNSFLFAFDNYNKLDKPNTYSIGGIIDNLFRNVFNADFLEEIKNISQKYCGINPDEKYDIEALDHLLIEKVKLFSFFNEETIDKMRPIEIIQCFSESLYLIKNNANTTDKYFFHKIMLKIEEILIYYKYKKVNYISPIFGEIGDIYFYGYLGPKDYLKAQNCYEMLLKLTEKNSVAELNLAVIYENGYGVKQDIQKAIELYKSSAKKLNSNAYINLGIIYMNGNYVIKTDYNKAIVYFKRAAYLGNSNGFLQIGLFYKNIKKDPKLSKEYFLKSIKQGEQRAILQLAILLEKEEGHKELIEYLYSMYIRKFEEEDKSLALIEIGESYFIEKDYEKAIEFYKHSLDDGNQLANFKLGSAYEKLNNFQIAEHYYKQGMKFDDPNCCYNLVVLYENPIFGSKMKEIFECYNKIFQICIHQTDYEYNIISKSLKNLAKYFMLSNLIDLSDQCFSIADEMKYPFELIFKALYLQLYHKKAEGMTTFKEMIDLNDPLAMIFYHLILWEVASNITFFIDFFIQASNIQASKNLDFNDKNDEFSLIFLFTLVDLLITSYFLEKENSDENHNNIKLYFNRALSKLMIHRKFEFHLNLNDEKTNFDYIWNFIVDFPPFNLSNQPHFINIIKKFKKSFNSSDNYDNNTEYFNDPGKFIDYICIRPNLRQKFKEEIVKFIDYLKSMLFQTPYTIFFGKIGAQYIFLKRGVSDINFYKELLNKINIK